MIESESTLVWKLIKGILLLPVTFILIFFGKRSFSDLFQPIKGVFIFIFEPKLTIFLVITNIFIYFLITLLFNTKIITEQFIETYFISSTTHFLNFQIIPLIGSWFFHASLLHLFSNMLFLFILGRVVERELGPGKTSLIYFGAAIISTIADNLVHIYLIPIENYSAVGASGAIAGLGAAALLLNPFYLSWLVFGIPLPIIAIVLLQIYTDITGVFDPTTNIGHVAHLAGYLSVAITMFIVGERDKMRRGFFICLLTLAAAFLIYFFAARYFIL